MRDQRDDPRETFERPKNVKTGSLNGITNLVKTTTQQTDPDTDENRSDEDTTSQAEK
ncbi:MAG: hypothetical protein ACYC28_08665 [Longimicrobiales bacterium]